MKSINYNFARRSLLTFTCLIVFSINITAVADSPVEGDDAILRRASLRYQNLAVELTRYQLEFDATYFHTSSRGTFYQSGDAVRVEFGFLSGPSSTPPVLAPSRAVVVWRDQYSSTFFERDYSILKLRTPAPEFLGGMPASPRDWMLGINGSPALWAEQLNPSSTVAPAGSFTVKNKGDGKWEIQKQIGEMSLFATLDEAFGLLVTSYEQKSNGATSVRGDYEWELDDELVPFAKEGHFFTDPKSAAPASEPQFSWKVDNFSTKLNPETDFDFNRLALSSGLLIHESSEKKPRVVGKDSVEGQLQFALIRASNLLRSAETITPRTR